MRPNLPSHRRENAELNGVSGTTTFQCADVFDLLPALEAKGEQFDVVILDPPAFTKSRSSVKNAIRKGYREINIRGLRLVKDGGYFATCSCSHFMTPELFTKAIQEAARRRPPPPAPDRIPHPGSRPSDSVGGG